MNSSFLCVIVIGILFQVFAQDQFHSQLWRANLEKITEKNNKVKAYELAAFVAGNILVEGEHPVHQRADKTKAYLVCAEKTGVHPDTILSIKRGDWAEGDIKAKAWVQCVLMENKLMTDQSVFRQDVAFKYLTDSERQTLEANIDKCLPNKEMLPVEISWQFAKCFQAADPASSLF